MGKIQDIVSRFLSFKRSKQSPGLNNLHQQLDLDPVSILVVDDDATIRKTLSAYLEDKGARVVTASNGQEGIEKLEQNSFDLMLLDLCMPGMTGIDVIELVRNKYNGLTLPIIMLTSCDEAEDMVKALEAGANDYVVKAGDVTVLLARIETQFSLKTMNRTLAVKQEELQRSIANNKIAIEMAKANLGQEIYNRMEAENALAQSETRFKLLYDNTPTMCFAVDTDGEILSVNRYGAHNLGFERSELIGRSLYMTYHGEDGEEIRQCLINVINLPDRQHQWELRRLHKDGHVIRTRETAKRITDTNDNPSILLVSVEIDAPVLQGNQCSKQ